MNHIPRTFFPKEDLDFLCSIIKQYNKSSFFGEKSLSFINPRKFGYKDLVDVDNKIKIKDIGLQHTYLDVLKTGVSFNDLPEYLTKKHWIVYIVPGYSRTGKSSYNDKIRWFQYTFTFGRFEIEGFSNKPIKALKLKKEVERLGSNMTWELANTLGWLRKHMLVIEEALNDDGYKKPECLDKIKLYNIDVPDGAKQLIKIRLKINYPDIYKEL